MHINLSSDIVPPPSITLGPNTLQVVDSTKLLGVTIDNKLNWKPHVSEVVKSSSFRLHLLRRLKSLGVPAHELLSVYTTFILPKLTYASPTWSSSLNATQRKHLEKVQKRACKIILSPSYSTYQEALNTLTLSTLTDHHHDHICKFAKKLLHHPRHRLLLPPEIPSPRIAV